MKDDYLAHYGIKGMKWGVRRFQNADGSLTAAGKKRYGSDETSGGSKKKADGKKIAKTAAKVAGGALAAATLAGAAYIYAKNPTAVQSVIKSIGVATVDSIKNKVAVGRNYMNNFAEAASRKASSKAVKYGMKARNAVGNTVGKFVKGAREGLSNAPEKMGRAMAEGAAYIAGMYAVGKLLGGARADDMIKSYNAYNKKNKIGKVTSMDEFIRGGHYDDPDKDDDD